MMKLNISFISCEKQTFLYNYITDKNSVMAMLKITFNLRTT